MKGKVLFYVLLVTLPAYAQQGTTNLFQTKDYTLTLDNGNKIVARDYKGTATLFFQDKTAEVSKPFLFYQKSMDSAKYLCFFRIDKMFDKSFLACYGVSKTQPGKATAEARGSRALYANDGSGILGYWPPDVFIHATSAMESAIKKIIVYREPGSAGNIYIAYPNREGILAPALLDLSEDPAWIMISNRLLEGKEDISFFFRFVYHRDKVDLYLLHYGGKQAVAQILLNEKIEVKKTR